MQNFKVKVIAQPHITWAQWIKSPSLEECYVKQTIVQRRQENTVLLLGLQGGIYRFCEILQRVKQNLHYSTLSPVGKNQQDCLWFSTVCALYAFVLLSKKPSTCWNSNSIGTLKEKSKNNEKYQLHEKDLYSQAWQEDWESSRRVIW